MKLRNVKLLAASLACLLTLSCDVLPASAAQPQLYRSELTNEWISSSLQNQRPIAVMVDNEKVALPHYGMTQADVVYEMTNSLLNDGVTRFMAIVKDWGSITQFGSIRSVRPTNLQIAPEWNAVVCHDGGPFYINAYLANDFVENFSGTFGRVNNGKRREFTEYILPGDLARNFAKKGYSTTYNKYYQGPHYKFAADNAPTTLVNAPGSIVCNQIVLPYKHNNPYLTYNAQTGLYYYTEYGKAHVDPGNNNTQLSFKNLIIQKSRYVQLDAGGYMQFQCVDVNQPGYYLTNGRAIPITWTKNSDLDITRYYDANGNELQLNTGKTYVALVPDDLWAGVLLQ